MSAPVIGPTKEGISARDLGPCDNNCGKDAVPGISRGLYRYCSRECRTADAPDAAAVR